MRNTESHHCRHCGYDLVGLARQGSCPECGKRYDLDDHSSNWFDAEERTRRRLTRLRTVLFIIAAMAIVSCGGVSSLIARSTSKFLWVSMLLCGIFLLAAATSYVYEK